MYGEGASDVQIALGGGETVNCVALSCFSVLGFFEAGIYLSGTNHGIRLRRLIWQHFTFSALSLIEPNGPVEISAWRKVRLDSKLDAPVLQQEHTRAGHLESLVRSRWKRFER